MNDFDTRISLAQDLRKRYSQQAAGAQSPQGRMVGNQFVAPNVLEYLAQGLRGIGGMQGEAQADKELGALQTQRTEGNQKALADFLRQSRGQAASEGMPANEMDSGMNMGAVKAQAPNMQGAYASLMQAPDQSMRQMGMQGMTQLPQIQAQQQEREDNRTFRADESKLAREARAQELQQRLTDSRASQTERLQAQKELREMQIQAQKDTQRMIAANRPDRQAQIIQTEQGPMQLVGGKAIPIIGPDGKAVSGKPVAGPAAATKVQDAKDALSTISMAEKLIGEATGSGVGSLVDTAAGWVGKSTKGAQAAARLKALEGDLVAKMPKMSGPQSDKDVLLYRQMAGQIGDPGIPQETKRAALESIKEMQMRYAGMTGGASGGWESSPVDALLEKYK